MQLQCLFSRTFDAICVLFLIMSTDLNKYMVHLNPIPASSDSISAQLDSKSNSYFGISKSEDMDYPPSPSIGVSTEPKPHTSPRLNSGTLFSCSPDRVSFHKYPSFYTCGFYYNLLNRFLFNFYYEVTYTFAF